MPIDPNEAYLRQQLAALTRSRSYNPNQVASGAHIRNANQISSINGQLMQLAMNRNVANAREQMAAQDAEAKRIQALQDENNAAMLRNTEGRANELRSDPRATAALDFLQGVTAGDTVPFGQEMRANYLTSAADAAGAQEAAQTQALQEQIAASGGSMNDPSAQAALRELASRRGGMIAGAQNQIGMQAETANFGARMGGATGLAAVNNAQNAQINQMLGGANQVRADTTFNHGGQPNTNQVLGAQFVGGPIQTTRIGPAPTQPQPYRQPYVPGQAPPGSTVPITPRQPAGGGGQPPPAPQPQPATTPAPRPGYSGGYASQGNAAGGRMPTQGAGWPAVGVNQGGLAPGYGVGQLTGQPGTAQYFNNDKKADFAQKFGKFMPRKGP